MAESNPQANKKTKKNLCNTEYQKRVEEEQAGKESENHDGGVEIKNNTNYELKVFVSNGRLKIDKYNIKNDL